MYHSHFFFFVNDKNNTRIQQWVGCKCRSLSIRTRDPRNITNKKKRREEERSTKKEKKIQNKDKKKKKSDFDIKFILFAVDQK